MPVAIILRISLFALSLLIVVREVSDKTFDQLYKLSQLLIAHRVSVKSKASHNVRLSIAILNSRFSVKILCKSHGLSPVMGAEAPVGC